MLFLPIVAALLISGCAEVSPAYGQYFKGRTLAVSVVNVYRASELRYAAPDGQGGLQNIQVAPSEEGMELVVAHLKVENHTATSAILNVDDTGAELRDFASGKYFPIDITERAKIVEAGPRRGDDSFKILNLQSNGAFAPNRGFISGPFELDKGTGLDGWMVFEAPIDTKFRSFRWRAGDSLTITF